MNAKLDKFRHAIIDISHLCCSLMSAAAGKEDLFYYYVNTHCQHKPAKAFFQTFRRQLFAYCITDENPGNCKGRNR